MIDILCLICVPFLLDSLFSVKYKVVFSPPTGFTALDISTQHPVVEGSAVSLAQFAPTDDSIPVVPQIPHSGRTVRFNDRADYYYCYFYLLLY